MNADKAVEWTAASPLQKLSEAALITWLSDHPNDLEPPAIALHPQIGNTLAALRAAPGCKLARMSGSGATCFGLFSEAGAQAAAQTLHSQHPDWWVRATMFGENLDGNSPA
jgi:4-diphosphocytidyl-2-C-methyl-D-erythritol kinase